MLDKFTPEQEAKLPEYAEKWLAIGLSTARVEKECATEAIAEAYRAVNLTPPKVMLLQSPLAGALAAQMMRKYENHEAEVVADAVLRYRNHAKVASTILEINEIDGTLAHRLRAQLRVKIVGDVWPQIEREMVPYVEKHIASTYRNHALDADLLTDHIKSAFIERYTENPPMEAGDAHSWINNMMFGCHDAHWLAFYDFFGQETDLEGPERLNGLMHVAKTCGWVDAYELMALVQDRPCNMSFDTENRLHADGRMAIEYTDGFGVYVWKGVGIPGEWMTHAAESLTPEKALTWPNVEQRRCACEILTWKTIVDTLKPVVIDKDEYEAVGTLMEVDLPNSGKERFLEVTCGTGRKFVLPVPPTMKTAIEANSWTYGVNEGDIRDMEVRT